MIVDLTEGSFLGPNLTSMVMELSDKNGRQKGITIRRMLLMSACVGASIRGGGSIVNPVGYGCGQEPLTIKNRMRLRVDRNIHFELWNILNSTDSNREDAFLWLAEIHAANHNGNYYFNCRDVEGVTTGYEAPSAVSVSEGGAVSNAIADMESKGVTQGYWQGDGSEKRLSDSPAGGLATSIGSRVGVGLGSPGKGGEHHGYVLGGGERANSALSSRPPGSRVSPGAPDVTSGFDGKYLASKERFVAPEATSLEAGSDGRGPEVEDELASGGVGKSRNGSTDNWVSLDEEGGNSQDKDMKEGEEMGGKRKVDKTFLGEMWKKS